MAYSSEEVKSGFIVTLALAFLLALTFLVGNWTRGAAETWKIRFTYVSGLKKNAPVYVAGHEVGRVARIEYVRGEEKPILVSVLIPDRIELREDSQAFIDTLGLMGEKFVEIAPGSAASPLLRHGSMIPSTDPVRMYLLIQKMDRLATQMEEMMANLNPLAQQVSGTLRTHQEEISKIISNLHETSAHLRDMTNDLKYRPWRLVRKG